MRPILISFLAITAMLLSFLAGRLSVVVGLSDPPATPYFTCTIDWAKSPEGDNLACFDDLSKAVSISGKVLCPTLDEPLHKDWLPIILDTCSDPLDQSNP